MSELTRIILSPHLWISIALVIVTFLIWKCIKKLIKRQINNHDFSGKRETNIHVVMMIIKIILAIMVIAAVLQINGINISSLVTGLGIMGIIIGFAVQDILKDFMMGTNIVWDNFFKIGDVVRYKGIDGKITYFNIKVTKILDVNTGNVYAISNRNITEIELLSTWLDVVVPAPYSIEAPRMRDICHAICDRIAENDEVTACEFLGTDEFAPSQVNYKIRLHCPSDKKAPMKRMALGIVQDVFIEEKISMPYPHMDVNIINNN